jgi:hypothetical protein
MTPETARGIKTHRKPNGLEINAGGNLDLTGATLGLDSTGILASQVALSPLAT